jgi:multiple sugar transport system substrate-binding protein
MKKWFFLALLLIGVTACVFAQAAEETKVTITVAVYPDLDSVVKNVLPAFYALYPNIEVELEVAGYGDHHTKLLTVLAAGKGVPDVTAVEIGYIARFSAEGGFLDLSQPPYNAEAYADLYVPYAWQQAHTMDGRLVAMPADVAPATMFWRRDIFAERGVSIDEIKTWDDYIAAGEKLTYDADGDGKIDHWLVDDAATVAMILWGGHTRFFDEEGNCVVDSPRFVHAFEIAKSIRDNGYDARISAWTGEWYESFSRGTVATAINGAWMLGHFKNWIAPETTGKWGAAHLPGGTYTQRGGTWYGIPEAAEHKDEAWKLVKFLTTNPDIQLRAFEVTNAFPAELAVWEDPIFEKPIPFLADQTARLLWKEAVLHITGAPTNVNDAIAMEIVTDALTQVLEEGRAIEDVLAEAKELIERRVAL